MSADSDKVSVAEFIFLCVCGFMLLSVIHIRVGIDRIRKQQLEMNQKLTILVQMAQSKEVYK